MVWVPARASRLKAAEDAEASKIITVKAAEAQAEAVEARAAAEKAAAVLAGEGDAEAQKALAAATLAELEAESVAYIVCQHFALDTEVRSSRYIALWDGNSKALRESMERIADTARALIDDVEAVAARKAVA